MAPAPARTPAPGSAPTAAETGPRAAAGRRDTARSIRAAVVRSHRSRPAAAEIASRAKSPVPSGHWCRADSSRAQIAWLPEPGDLLDGLHHGLDHLLGVAEHHHRLVHVEQLIVQARVAGGHRTLVHDDL